MHLSQPGLDNLRDPRPHRSGHLLRLPRWRVGAFSMGQWKQRAKNAKQAMMEKLRAELLESERGAERESHLRLMRVLAQDPGSLEDPSTPGYAPRP